MDTLAIFITAGAIGGSALLVNAILLVNIFVAQRKASAAQNWPIAVGTVVESRLESWRSSNNRAWVNYPCVTYAYSVGGQFYARNRLSPGLEAAVQPLQGSLPDTRWIRK